MKKIHNEILNKLITTIHELEFESDFSIQKTETIIKLIIQSLSDLKGYVLKNGFKNTDEEIQFFKYQKPAIVSKLIYYNAVYKIETKKPYGEKQTKNFLTKELNKLKKFFDNNIDFYKYYRSNNSFLDENFFIRGKLEVKETVKLRFCTELKADDTPDNL